MTTLVPIDGSEASMRAIRHAANAFRDDDLVLLYVAPSGRASDLERGRFFLQDGIRLCLDECRQVRVTTRLEVGDRCTAVLAHARECDRIVMGACGQMSHLDPISAETAEVASQVGRPVILVGATGETLPAG
jgi:nucleotide-binding universal stress UspA family protein